jgi:cytochrome c oxidase cbb3-type subunit 3
VTSEHLDRQSSSDDQDHVLDHSYDGIQEYDNPLPRWWLALFWATIIFAPLYILYFHFGGGMLGVERYDQEMIAFYDKQAEELQAKGNINENTLAGLMADPSMTNNGKKIFQSKCATCHGMFGEGGIGPNLTDDYWLHGGQLMNIYTTIREGVPTKGMLAWERQLRPAELMAVAAYVGTLLGSEPPNPKPPQGEKFVRQPPSAVGSTGTATAEASPEIEAEPTAS